MKLQLSKLRSQIDKVDQEIISLLGQRFKITQKVGLYKKIHKLKPFDKQREIEMKKHIFTLAQKNNLDQKFVWSIFTKIILKVKKRHKEILK